MENEIKIPTMVPPDKCAALTNNVIPAEGIRELAKKGRIVFVPVGKKLLINLEKYIEFLNTNTEWFSEKKEELTPAYGGVKPVKLF